MLDATSNIAWVKGNNAEKIKLAQICLPLQNEQFLVENLISYSSFSSFKCLMSLSAFN